MGGDYLEKLILWLLSAGLSSEFGFEIATILVMKAVIPIMIAVTMHFAVKFTLRNISNRKM